MRRSIAALVLWVAGLGILPAYAGPVWQLDLAGSSIDLGGSATADNFFGPNFNSTLSASAYSANVMYDAVAYDFGASVNPVAMDNDAPPGGTSASSVGYVGIKGIGTPTLTVHFRATTLNDNSGPDAFRGVSFALLNSAHVASDIDLAGSPAGNYPIHWEWDFFANAATLSEGPFEDSARTQGGISTTINGIGVGPAGVYSSGGGVTGTGGTISMMGDDLVMVPLLGLSMPVDAAAFAQADMNNPGKGPLNSDLCGSEIIGELRLTIGTVPEPSTALMLLVMCGLLVAAQLRRGLQRLRVGCAAAVTGSRGRAVLVHRHLPFS